MALSDGLIAYWSPWLGSSGYRLLDRARSNHGTLFFMDAPTDWQGASIAGRSGYVLDFDAVDDVVQAPAPVLSQITTDITLSFWTKLNATGVQSVLFTAGFNVPDAERMNAHAPWSDNNIYWDFGGSTGNNRLTVTGQTWNTTSWNHLVFQSTRQGLRAYRNGLLVGSTSIAVTRTASATQVFDIGRGVLTAGTFRYSGKVAECAGWNRVLSAPEIIQLYRFGPGWYQPYAKRGYANAIAAGFKAYWHRRQQQIIGGGLR